MTPPAPARLPSIRLLSGFPRQYLAGILILACSTLFFSTSDMIAKLMAGALPPFQLAWTRLAIFFAMASLLAMRSGIGTGIGIGIIRTRHKLLHVLRGAGVAGAALLMIVALGYMPLSVAVSVNFVCPAILTALSVVFLHERVGPRRWAAVAAGLIGVVVIVRPGSEALQLAALIPVGAAFTWAVALLISRAIGASERAETTLLWSSASGFALLSLTMPFVAVLPDWHDLLLSVVMGFCSATGQTLIVLSYRRAPATVLAPFLYLQVIASVSMDNFIFGTLPDLQSLAGMAIIIGAGLYSILCERRASRAAAAAG